MAEFLVRVSHILTPGLRGWTHDFWAAAIDIADEQDPRKADAPEIGLAADGAGLRVRQVLQRRLEAEGRTLA